ncbi:coiled-coil and C2 domain-containing protein 1-like isoform X2 [Venturia canescens]|uniref:coiled-coil and C2 domain-containing protein 1-like isoform X2 n=1 Tax=Venturia canescens TaxID=32260 RepID=UPI001C9CDF76|nr:coiled-coil and C2 domain-containing protein 1-like isoform X2 [Venturia canescens]
MFSKKKEVKKRPRDPASLEQFGIFNVPDANLENMSYSMEDDNDDDLEAELALLTSGDDLPRQPRRKAPPLPAAKLDAMINESMKDIDADEDLSGDDDDPDLLDELREITGEDASPLEEEAEKEVEEPQPKEETNNEETIKLLEERLSKYKIAETKAKNENESGRARRYGRGVKTIEGLLASAQSGRAVTKADIPPELPPSATGEVSAPKADSPGDENTETQPPIENPSPPEEPPAEAPASEETPKAPEINQEALELLKKRQHEYKVAALAWKKSGNITEAMNHVKIAKQFDIVIQGVEAGEAIDVSDMPPSPQLPSSTPPTEGKEESESQQQAPSDEPAPTAEAPRPAVVTGDAIADALKERLEIYRRTKTAAEEEGNSSKSRRYGRICKQFEDAIKLYARGKPVAFEELPIPPGLPPIMLNPSAPPAPTPTAQPPREPIPQPEPQEGETPTATRRAPPVPSPKPTHGNRAGGSAISRAEKQALMLQRRQAELKQAALAAKKDGDLELAKDYLRQAKQITPLIETSRCGLPVDMSSIPISPNAKNQLNASGLVDPKSEDGFTVVSSLNCLEEASGTDQQIYENMEQQLIKQAKWCLSTRDHSKAIGDVPGYNKWERLALGYRHDLDMLRVRKRDGLPPPQHHYEEKTYAIVQSFPDLGDGDIEISIIRGINYPKEADTYVIFEYPFPTDNHQTDRTATIRDTSNPEYEAVYTLNNAVDRSSRQCQRVFKRHSLKCQVWSKGCSLNPILCCTHPRGFFRSDSLVGTVSIKLAPLETQCILHDSFPLMDGRRAVGGKLEVKIRLRNPILRKQIEKITDKWLTIDG